MKKQFNKKIILGVLALLSVVLCIVVSSFVPFTFQPEKIKTNKFLTNELIIVAIVIIAMVSTIFIGQASNAQSEKSKLAKARVKFFNTSEKVTDLNGFFQWVKTVLQPRDIKAIKERKMRDVGISDYTVIDLDLEDLKLLWKNGAAHINDKYYKGLTDIQFKLLKKLKSGKLKVHLVDPTYYITLKTFSGNKTITEKAATEATKKGLFLSTTIILKVILTVFVGVIFGSLAKDLLESQDVAESVLTFGSRMLAMATSSYFGYMTGCQINDIDAEYIEMRCIVHNQYLQDKEFKPKTTQELAKSDYLSKHKEEIKEANLSVISKDKPKKKRKKAAIEKKIVKEEKKEDETKLEIQNPTSKI